MNLEHNKDYVVKFLKEVYERGNYEILDEILHTDYGPHPSIRNIAQVQKMDLYGGFEKVKERVEIIKEGVSG